MNHRLIAAALVVILAACASSGPTNSPPPPPPPGGTGGINGSWALTWEVTTATGVCGPEFGEVTHENITFTQTGTSAPYQVTARGFLGVNGNQLTGTMNANREITLTGNYPEDGGTLTASYAISWDGANGMIATETWTWTGPGGTCPNSVSSVTGTRI